MPRLVRFYTPCILISFLWAWAPVFAKAKNQWVQKKDLPTDEVFLVSQFSAVSPVQAEKRASRIIAQGRTKRTVSTAVFLRGLARYRLGRYHDAELDFEAALKGPIVNSDLAEFFYGESVFHQGDYRRAKQIFQKFRRRYRLSNWRHRARLRIADCSMAMGNAKSAVSIFEESVKDYPDYPHPVALRLVIANAYQQLGRLDTAYKWLEEAALQFPEAPLTRAVRRALDAVRALGGARVEYSPNELYSLALRLRKARYPHLALPLFETLAQRRDAKEVVRWRAGYQIGRCHYQMEHFKRGLKMFKEAINTAPTTGLKHWAYRWTSYSLERLGRYQEAAENLLKGYGNPVRPSAKAIKKLAWMYFNGAQYARALKQFERLSKLGGRFERNTRFMRTWLRYRLGRFSVAAKEFGRLGQQRGRGKYRYLYWQARCLTRMGKKNKAEALYRQIVVGRPNGYYAYQSLARLRDMGREPIADFVSVHSIDQPEPIAAPPEAGINCEDEEDDARCREPVKLPDAVDNRTHTNFETEKEKIARVEPFVDSVAQVAVEKDSGRRAFYGDPVSLLRQLVEQYGNGFPALESAFEFAVMGEHQWAIRKLRRVTDELRAFRRASAYKRKNWAFKWIPYADFRKGVKRGDWGIRSLPAEAASSRRRVRFLKTSKGKQFWRMLRATYSALGDHYYARRHRPRGERLEWPPEGDDNRRWRIHFAQAFEPAVRSHAAHYGLDPAFVWALMTVESNYNPWAISHADARGLMQVMPQTGALVTGRMNWPNFGTALLYEPEVAIEIAVWYFYQLLEKFHGQLPIAIASYNAGPHRGAAWLRVKGHLAMDEFIEEIPYSEARAYTKHVLTYLALYRRIYRGHPGSWISQEINPKFENNINF